MKSKDPKPFTAAEYWKNRVRPNADLSIVGHRSMGLAYNEELYSRRVEALDEIIHRNLDQPIADLRVLDLGCGTGFYAQFWMDRGVRDYVGLDLSSANFGHLSNKFPDYEFVQADASSDSLIDTADLGTFDLITAFDVLYHIVDSGAFTSTVGNIGSLCRNFGVVLVMDQLYRAEYQLSRHVIYRSRTPYLSLFRKQNLELVDTEMLFHFMLPPISGVRLLDIPVAAVGKVFGLALRQNRAFSRWTARKLRKLDKSLRTKDVRIWNSELLLFERRQ